ncbi:MAG: hypothetical protein JXC32_19380 [Anaerolineae bacterium]|nr:hypothetical protein [Anaerolineae bacterium]
MEDLNTVTMGRWKRSATDSPQEYRIAVRGSLDGDWLTWLGEAAIEVVGEVTLVSVTLPDQAALRGLLSQLWDLNLTIVSVNPA